MLAALLVAVSLQTLPPADYVVSKFADHRVVIFGEAHWVRQEVELVRSVVPRLPQAGVSVIAIEMLTTELQPRIDALVSAPEWNEREAIALLRHAAWPYREYLDVMHAVWETNHGASHNAGLRLVALQPAAGWRERGESYDAVMARTVLDAIGKSGRALVYAGMHHGFTRFVQPWMPAADKVDGFFDRAGNILHRALGEDVFLIVTHHPWQCRAGGKWTSCLPLDGAIDCAMKSPGGFDVDRSPFAEMRLGPGAWYAMGSPLMRFVDFTDGYVWLKPLDQLESVSLIPLASFAPDAAARDEVRRNNPLSDSPALSDEELEKLWTSETRSLSSFLERRHWTHLANWRSACH